MNLTDIKYLNKSEENNYTDYDIYSDIAFSKNCRRLAIEEFPKLDWLNSPWSIILPSLVVIYSVLLLAKVCDQHFIPSIKIICYGLGLGSDVAGATLMAAGVSSPDLFVNLVGTFLTEGDIGVGTVVGCGVINTLIVPALCVLLSSTKEIRLRYWAISRDCLFYCLSVTFLVCSLQDGQITVIESGSMITLYFIYIIIMSNNNWFRTRFEHFWKKIRRKTLTSNHSLPLLMKPVASTPYGLAEYDEDETNTCFQQLLQFDEDSSIFDKVLFIIGWPLDLVLYLTMPSCWKRCNSTTNGLIFCICLIWIGLTSYLVAWMITIMGFELGVADSLMGLTFLAIGMSVPESLTSIIVAKQGHGSMALGNVLGSNIFDVLACLGLPWFIKAAFFSPEGVVEINSKGLSLSSSLLLGFLALFYFSIAFNGFYLKRNIAVMCIILYLIFALIATLTEMNVFFVYNLPSCDNN